MKAIKSKLSAALSVALFVSLGLFIQPLGSVASAQDPVGPNFLELSHEKTCGSIAITLRNVSPWIYPASVEIDGVHSYGPVVDNRTNGGLNGPQKDQSRTRTINFLEGSGTHTVRYRIQAGTESSLYVGLPVGEWVEVTVEGNCAVPPTTTTTTVPDSTTTTTVPDSTTTTTVPDSTTTTTQPNSTTSTTAPPTTTTTKPTDQGPGSTNPPDTTGPTDPQKPNYPDDSGIYGDGLNNNPTKPSGPNQGTLDESGSKDTNQNNLPPTGSNSSTYVMIGLGLLGAGIAVVILGRRNRLAHEQNSSLSE